MSLTPNSQFMKVYIVNINPKTVARFFLLTRIIHYDGICSSPWCVCLQSTLLITCLTSKKNIS